MSSCETQIRDAVQAFVIDISRLVRQAALEAVREAVGGDVAATAMARRRPSGRSTRARPGRVRKRTPQELERTTARLLDHITNKPGERIEQIAVALRTSTRELALPAKKLITAKSVKVEGVKRATTYWRQ